MKTFAMALTALIVSTSAFAKDNNPLTPADVQQWHQQQAQIQRDYARLPAAEQQRIKQQQAYWEEKSFKENDRNH